MFVPDKVPSDDCDGSLVLYHKPKTSTLTDGSDVTNTKLTNSNYPRRSLSWLREKEVLYMKLIGDKCCWHIKHYKKMFDTPMHYEHIGIGWDKPYPQKGHLQNLQTSFQKDPGIKKGHRNRLSLFEYSPKIK